MVIDFTFLLYMLLALHVVLGIIAAAFLGFGVWGLTKYKGRLAAKKAKINDRAQQPSFATCLIKL